MTIQDLGSIGELLAAAATIATLLYLSLQIRQTNRISKSAVIGELQQKYIDFYNVILANDEFAELLANLTDAGYKAKTETENQKLETLSILIYSIWFSAQTSFDQGQIDEETYKAYCEDVTARLEQWPAMRPYFIQTSKRYASTAHKRIYEPIFRDNKSHGSAT